LVLVGEKKYWLGMFNLIYLLILNFRQISIDSEKTIPISIIDQQAKLIEVEKTETGSVCVPIF